jgi:hypothetical protein
MNPAVPLAALAAVLSACAPIALVSSPDPADPAAPISPQRYVPVTAGTRAYQPAEPKPWAEINKGVTPRREGEQ